MFPIWALLELLLFIKLVSVFGFLKIFALYTLPSFLGFFILTSYPQSLLGTLQSSMQKQKKPTTQMLHSLFIFISAVLFIIPSAITRIIGLILFLPILRHLVVFLLVWQWFRLSAHFLKRFQNFNFSQNGFKVYTHFGRSYNPPPEPPRDVSPQQEQLENSQPPASTDIIDVTPKKPLE